MNNQETTEVITELETKIAFLEAANEELERALLSQHERIDRLDIVVSLVASKLRLRDESVQLPFPDELALVAGT